jgi:hypothetical protein
MFEGGGGEPRSVWYLNSFGQVLIMRGQFEKTEGKMEKSKNSQKKFLVKPC